MPIPVIFIVLFQGSLYMAIKLTSYADYLSTLSIECLLSKLFLIFIFGYY